MVIAFSSFFFKIEKQYKSRNLPFLAEKKVHFQTSTKMTFCHGKRLINAGSLTDKS